MDNTILLLRYSDFKGVDTIAAHKEVIESSGSCWWAKIGRQPSKNYLSKYMNQEEKVVMLYTPGCLHLCKMGRVIHRRPKANYPAYYERDIFDREDEPATYFELLSMEKVDVSLLDNFVVRVSGKAVMHDLKKTISSYMIIQDKDAPLPQKSVRPKKKKNVIYDYEHCKSKKDGICKNSYCVYYKMECSFEKTCRRLIPIKTIIEETSD